MVDRYVAHVENGMDVGTITTALGSSQVRPFMVPMTYVKDMVAGA